jgi:hypothetical protein
MKIGQDTKIEAIKKTLVWFAGISLLVLLAATLGPGAWLVLVAVGLVISIRGGKRILEVRAARMWPSVEATVVEVGTGRHVEPARYSPFVYFYPEIKLAYEVGGEGFEVVTYGLVKGDFRSLEERDAERLAQEYQVGDRVRLYVSPADSARAVLLPRMSSYQASSSWALMVSGVIVVGLAIGVGFLNAL